MNRPIKFRAWDKNDRRFLSEDDNVPNFLNLVPCQSTGQFIPMYMEIAESYIYDTDIILMQYTGLKDRSGKEIYEGDIVRLKTGAVGFYEYSEPHLAFAVRLKEPDYSGDGFIISKLDGWYNFDVEVIGNIYENPELLKGSP